MLLKKMIHPQLESLEGKGFERLAGRAIILRGQEILLLYTKRYDDYSFPGGGIDPHEDIETGLARELAEEIGAVSYKVLSYLGEIEEYRPYYKEEYDFMHMISHYYVCQLTGPLVDVQLEDYEIKNGMERRWISLQDAIDHNEALMASQSEAIGLSIERETYVLKLIQDQMEA